MSTDISFWIISPAPQDSPDPYHALPGIFTWNYTDRMISIAFQTWCVFRRKPYTQPLRRQGPSESDVFSLYAFYFLPLMANTLFGPFAHGFHAALKKSGSSMRGWKLLRLVPL